MSFCALALQTKEWHSSLDLKSITVVVVVVAVVAAADAANKFIKCFSLYQNFFQLFDFLPWLSFA